MEAQHIREAQRYAIDPDMSRFTVRAFASGMLAAMGHSPTLAIRDFTGDAEFAPESPDAAALHIKIKAGSLNLTNNVSDKDRSEIERTMNQEVLETARYPEISFESSKVSASKVGDGQYLINLVGELSLHGVTKSEPVSAQVAIVGDTLRAHGEFSLLQTAYGIKPVSIAGGTLKLKDELKCSFDILARKKAGNS
jgi:polyisoprenoid-binding protein YceI